jgi:hypothetical protein
MYGDVGFRVRFMNLCRECRKDFGSLSAFDAHRVGKHAYTFGEGLRCDPPLEDGRRCLDTAELEEAGWSRDPFGRWRTPAVTHRKRREGEFSAPWRA